MRSIVGPLLVLAVVAGWMVLRDADQVAAHEARTQARREAAQRAERHAREVLQREAERTERAAKVEAEAAGPRPERRAPVGPEDIEHAHEGLTLMLDHCFAEFRQRRPDAAGRLEVRFTLVKKSGYGTVEAIRVVDDPFADPTLRRCVEAGPEESFPVPDGDGRIDAKLGLDIAPRTGGTQ